MTGCGVVALRELLHAAVRELARCEAGAVKDDVKGQKTMLATDRAATALAPAPRRRPWHPRRLASAGGHRVPDSGPAGLIGRYRPGLVV